MDNAKLKEIIDSHGKWLNGEDGGSRADLRRADLCGADLRDANLRDANLRRADLCGADLCGANLRRANLCGANLCGADLRGADLRDANLCGADLCGADLCDANLCGANLPSKIIQVGPIGSRKSYTIYRVDEDVVQCGCWHGEGRDPYKGGTLEEFEKRVIAAYPLDTQHGKDYRAAIEYFKLMKEKANS